VALPSVQVLFALLLTVPLPARFGSIIPFQEVVFFATLVWTALSAGLLLAPSADHRLLVDAPCQGAPPAGDKPFRYRRYDGCWALAMMGTVFVIADVLLGSYYDASAVVGLIAAFFLYA
jgi:hypothetical protein